MAHGKTLDMRAIRKPAPVVIHRHIGMPRWVRRNRKLNNSWTGALVANEPYINGERDLRKGRRKKRAQ
jgi:hypothetical protein